MLIEYSLLIMFPDYILDGGTIVTKMSNLECVALCVNTHRCNSVFYSRNLESCMLSSTRYTDTRELSPRAGYGYFKMPTGFGSKCLTTANCRYKNSLCQKATCECEMGFSYDSRKERCVKKCTKYGDSYATYQDRSIEGFNEKCIHVTNQEDCIQACINELSFVCICVELCPINVYKNCNLNKVPWFDLPEGTAQEEKNWLTFYRHCAV